MPEANPKQQSAGNLKKSAGILVYNISGNGVEVLLGHPGGPFWKKKDAGSWTILKGEPEGDEELKSAAIREFSEETGWGLDADHLEPLTPVRQKAGKWIYAWSTKGYKAAAELRSNKFELEWPPRSGRMQSFDEIDQFAWFSLSQAKEKINVAQQAFIDELEKKLAGT